MQDRFKTKGMTNFLKNHCMNVYTNNLIIKRDFTLNDIYYFYQYLLKNNTVRHLHLSFIEVGVENNSNFLSPNAYVPKNNSTDGRKSKRKTPQILVPADRMEVTTTLHQPLSMFAHNSKIESNAYSI